MFLIGILCFVAFNWLIIWFVFIEFISVWVCVWCVFVQVDFVCVWIWCLFIWYVLCVSSVCIFLSLSFTVGANKIKILALTVVSIFIFLCCIGCFTVDWLCFVVIYDGVVGPLLFIAVTVGVSNRWVVGLWVWIFYGALGSVFILCAVATQMSGTGILVIYFFSVLIVCMLKVPLWPFHGWLPELHVESSTEVSVCLASILLKVGWIGVVKCVLCVGLGTSASCILYWGALIDGGVSCGLLTIGLNVVFCIDWKRLIAMWSLCHTGIVWCVVWHSDTMGMWVIGWGNVVHVITAGFGFYVVGILYSVVGIRVFCSMFGVWGSSFFSTMLFLVWWWWVEMPGSGGFWCDLIVGGCGVVGGWCCDVYAFVFIVVACICFWTSVWVLVVCGFFTHLWKTVWVRVDSNCAEITLFMCSFSIVSVISINIGTIIWLYCGGINGGGW